MDDEQLYAYGDDGAPIIAALHVPTLARMTCCPWCMYISQLLVFMVACPTGAHFHCPECHNFLDTIAVVGGVLFKSGIPSMDTSWGGVA